MIFEDHHLPKNLCQLAFATGDSLYPKDKLQQLFIILWFKMKGIISTCKNSQYFTNLKLTCASGINFSLPTASPIKLIHSIVFPLNILNSCAFACYKCKI